jgi:hypothetical protein
MPERTVEELLKDAFAAKHAEAAVKHFRTMVSDYQKSEWADAAAKGGKFVEAVMKALWVKAGETVPSAKDFKVGVLIDKLQQKPTASGIPDTIKLTIPRACRFAYEIASNRGARHDADAIDANEMDADAIVAVCSWILSEMVRFSQKGLDLSEAKAMVEGLMRRRFPFTEEIDGRVYTEIGSSAPETALGILFYIYPKRMPEAELIGSLVRHGYRHHNATVAVQRLRPYVDSDGPGNVRLRNTGLRKAQKLVSRAGRRNANEN